MLFLVCNLVALSRGKIPLLFNFIFLHGDYPVLLLKSYVGLFLDLVTPVDIVSEEADKEQGKDDKIKDQLLFFECGKLQLYFTFLSLIFFSCPSIIAI